MWRAEEERAPKEGIASIPKRGTACQILGCCNKHCRLLFSAYSMSHRFPKCSASSLTPSATSNAASDPRSCKIASAEFYPRPLPPGAPAICGSRDSQGIGGMNVVLDLMDL